jgi:hypothetical protein
MKFLSYPRSGSIDSTTFSRNRFGQYTRNRRSPVNARTSFQTQARDRLSTNAAAWRSLSAAQRAGWADLGAQMTRTDSLGQSYTLTGLQAYASVNNNLMLVGAARINDAPLLVEPAAIESVTPTATSSTFSIAWTPTPLGSGERILVYASPQVSAGVTYQGDLRFIQASAAAATSPLSIFTAWSGRFGAPIAGNRIFVSVARYSGGFLSARLAASLVVT